MSDKDIEFSLKCFGFSVEQEQMKENFFGAGNSEVSKCNEGERW